MNNTEQFDQFINQQLHSYSPDVPVDAWDKIVAAQKNKKPILAWWLYKYTILLLLLVMSTTVGLLINNYAFKNINTHSNKIIQKSTTVNSVKKLHSNANIVKNTALQTSDVNNTFHPLQQQENLATNGQLHVVNSIKVQSNLAAIKNTENNQPLKIGNNATFKSLLTKNSRVLYNQAKNNPTDLYKNSHASSTNRYAIAFNKKQKKNRFSRTSTFNNSNIIAVVTNEDSNDMVLTDDKSANNANDKMVNKMDANIQIITAIALQKKSIVLVDKAALMASPDCPTVEKNTAGNKKYVSIYASPDFVTKKYSDTGSSTFLNKRKESTQIVSAFTAGIQYTNVFANGVSISAALQYSQVNEKFSFVQSNYVQLSYTINPATGDTSNISTITGTRYKTTINRYRTIDMPILIGYEMGNTNWHVNVHAGAVVNMYSWQKGDALDVNLKPTSITTGIATDTYKYKTNIGVGIIVGASVFYKLNEKLHVMAAPFYRYNFSPISNATLSLQEKFSTIGIKLGVRVDL